MNGDRVMNDGRICSRRWLVKADYVGYFSVLLFEDFIYLFID